MPSGLDGNERHSVEEDEKMENREESEGGRRRNRAGGRLP